MLSFLSHLLSFCHYCLHANNPRYHFIHSIDIHDQTIKTDVQTLSYEPEFSWYGVSTRKQTIIRSFYLENFLQKVSTKVFETLNNSILELSWGLFSLFMKKNIFSKKNWSLYLLILWGSLTSSKIYRTTNDRSLRKVHQRQIDRWIDKWMDRWMDEYRQTDKQTNKRLNQHTKIHKPLLQSRSKIP